MDIKATIQHNKLMQLENLMLMMAPTMWKH